MAHVLHTPVTALEDAEVAELMAWADDAAELTARLYPKKGR